MRMVGHSRLLCLSARLEIAACVALRVGTPYSWTLRALPPRGAVWYPEPVIAAVPALVRVSQGDCHSVPSSPSFPSAMVWSIACNGRP